MDNAQKAIMIGVGIFITLLIIAAVMAIVNLGIGFMNTGTDRAEALRDAIVNSLYDQYDGKTISGARVVTACKTYYTEENMVLEVQPTAGGNYIELGKAKGNGTATLDKQLTYPSDERPQSTSVLEDSTKPDTYVPTSARYRAELIKTSSGDVVLGIIFTRVK